jgi:Fe-S-cluster-containing dehydrogenase component
MIINRRSFLKWSLLTTGGAILAGPPHHASASTPKELNPGRWGVLVDVTLCIGCRVCEWACKMVNHLPCEPLETFGDQSAFEKRRRPDAESYTIVNRYFHPEKPEQPIYVKFQCMHCDYPACASACLVGALQKHPSTGAVNYNASKCIGCRYCMVACPFQIPAYEYFNALNPKVRKCTFCFERVTQQGEMPACVKICPQEVMIFGKRQELIMVARERMAKHTDQYVPYIYGEHEGGGTSWLYLAQFPFDKLGYFPLGKEPVTHLTENVQHALFNDFMTPIALYGFLGALMWLFRDKGDQSRSSLSGKGSTDA